MSALRPPEAPSWPRSLLALLPPLLSLGIQWLLWGLIQPYVWFLAYPAVFVSSWIGGLRGGLLATVLSTGLVWWFFVPPAQALVKAPAQLFPAGAFIIMGILFAAFHDRLRKATRQAVDALAASRRANQEISRLYEKTRELDELKTQLFASVSHELRTPLTLILGPAERMLAASQEGSPARRNLGVITRNARTLLGHVNDLLDLSKLEAGEIKADYVETDLARLARFICGHFEVLSAERRTTLRVEAPDALAAQLDPDKVQRILLNLLSNAFKFTPLGGQVRLTLRGTAERVVIEVADSGPGIPADKREAVFERFRQLEGSTNRRFAGTGLGLSIVRQFVLLHQGSISISTAPEGGALFVVELPRKAPSFAVVRPGAAVMPEVRAELRQAVGELRVQTVAPPVTGAGDALVLVVEDNPEMSRFISDNLVDRYRVACAFDGKEGLARARELHPDLILSDIMMPEMSGEELVLALRRSRELDSTPIVLLSARADDPLRVKLLQEGAQDYLTKPFSMEELRARVENLVVRKRGEAALKELQRLREEWASIIAHDLQQPINAIALRSGLLLRGNLDDAQRGDARRILAMTLRLGRMVNDLTDASLLETNHLSLNLARLELGAVLREAVDRLPEAASRIRVRTPAGRPLLVRGDAGRLEQVIANLLTNAVKYGAAHTEILLSASEAAGCAEISVTNRGAGIPPEELPTVFERYVRAHAAQASAKKGAGLGLYIAKGLVEAHGGRIWVTSAAGETCFHFTVPLEAAGPSLPREEFATQLHR